MSRPRAATSVAIRIEWGDVGEEKRSRERRRAFWIILEWRGWAGRFRFARSGERRLTEAIELVKTRVLEG